MSLSTGYYWMTLENFGDEQTTPADVAQLLGVPGDCIDANFFIASIPSADYNLLNFGLRADKLADAQKAALPPNVKLNGPWSNSRIETFNYKPPQGPR